MVKQTGVQMSLSDLIMTLYLSSLYIKHLKGSLGMFHIITANRHLENTALLWSI